MKMFDRALRRSGISVIYSQGFNPHPQIVLGLPLPVGVTSEAEYADFGISEDLNPQDFMDKLNRNLPKGFLITKAAQKTSKGNIMASITTASYEVLVLCHEDINLQEEFHKHLLKNQIFCEKRSKGKVKEIDIRPMIKNLEVVLPQKTLQTDGEENFCWKFNNSWIDLCINNFASSESFNGEAYSLSMILSAGSGANLKPELVVESFNKDMNGNLEIIKIHRSGLFVEVDGRLSDPLEENAL